MIKEAEYHLKKVEGYPTNTYDKTEGYPTNTYTLLWYTGPKNACLRAKGSNGI